jgi:predicted nucleic-acid-binding protein
VDYLLKYGRNISLGGSGTPDPVNVCVWLLPAPEIAVLARSRSQGESVYISTLVLCETACLLRSVFSRSRAEILEVIARLLDTDVFQVEAEDAVRATLHSRRSGKGDFADHLIGHMNLAKGCRSTVTFDRSLGGAAGFSAL